MYIVIVGAGVGGYHISSLLSRDGHSVVVIDQAESALNAIRRYLDVKTILGSGANPRVLREAEIQRADLLLAVTDSDETNMVTCFLAKALGVKKTIARVRNPEYSGYLVSNPRSAGTARRVITPETLGISLFVNPDIIAAEEVANILSGLYTTPVEDFASGRVQAREFRVDNPAISGKTVRDIAFPRPCRVIAVVRPSHVVFPKPEEVLKEGDRVWVISATETMDELGSVFGEPKPQAKNVVILGAEHTGFRLAQILEKRGLRVKLIDPDEARCEQAAKQLERVEVIQDAGTNGDNLIEEGVPSADAFIAATWSDELNILVALLVKNLGASRSLALVESPQYVLLAETVGVDVTVSPLLLTAGRIARFVRSSSVVNVSFLMGTLVEATEFSAVQGAKIIGRPLKEVSLPKDAVIGAVVHGEAVIFPQDDTVIEAGDTVIVIGLPAAVHTIEKLFE